MAEPFKFPTAEEITRDWGERCTDFDQDCGCCQMWATYDLLSTKDADLSKLREEVGRLREALKPFAGMSTAYGREDDASPVLSVLVEGRRLNITVGDLRAALNATEASDA